MTPQKLEHLRTAFTAVMANPEEFSNAFFTSLNNISPQLHHAFQNGIASKPFPLIGVIQASIEYCSNPEGFEPHVLDVVERCLAHDIRPQDFPAIETAMAWSLQQIMAEDLTEEIREACIEGFEWFTHELRAYMQSNRLRGVGSAEEGAKQGAKKGAIGKMKRWLGKSSAA